MLELFLFFLLIGAVAIVALKLFGKKGIRSNIAFITGGVVAIAKESAAIIIPRVEEIPWGEYISDPKVLLGISITTIAVGGVYTAIKNSKH